jgi:hypothetical protein
VIKRFRGWWYKLDSRDPNDVTLNQPGRALARCILWGTLTVAFGSFPAGLAVLELPSTIEPINYVLGNIAGLLLSGLIWLLLVPLILTIFMVAAPLLGSSRVPRPPVDREEG